MNAIRKKVYTQSYLLINSNRALNYSFGVRLKYTGLSFLIAGYAIGRLFFNSKRAVAADGEEF